MLLSGKWTMRIGYCSLILLIITLFNFINSTAFAYDTEKLIESALTEIEDGMLAPELRCGTPDVTQAVAEQIQQKISPLLQNRNYIMDGVSQVVGFPSEGIIIPVAFHVIHSGEEGKISEYDITAQIDVLNNAYFGAGVQFMLSEVDYTDNPAWFGIEKTSEEMLAVKAALTIDSSRYLNIYTNLLKEGLLGFATFPDELAEKPDLDGLVLLYKTLPGGSEETYNEGDTAVHEIGHWLGLYHTFQTFLQNISIGKVIPSANLFLNSGCLGPGDYVDDTPAERSPSFKCSESRNTCLVRQGKDPVHNYMDYTPDACMDEFTPEQGKRIQAMIVNYRPLLLETSTATTTVPGNPSTTTTTVTGGPVSTTTVIGGPVSTTTSVMEGNSKCDFNEGVSRIWDLLNQTVPSFDEYPLPGADWQLYIHPTYPLIGFFYPPDWTPTSIEDQTNIGVELVRNDGAAIYQILVSNAALGTSTIGQLLDNNVRYVLDLLGENSPATQRCFMESQSTPGPGLTINSKDIAITAGETTMVASVQITTSSGLPLSQIYYETMAGPSSEFTTLTEEVFFPIIFQMY